MKAHTAVTVAPAKEASRKSRGSISGSSRRSSQGTNAASAPAAASRQDRISGEVQPWPGASMTAYVSVPSAPVSRSCPTGSARRGRGARDSGTNTAASTSAASPMGTLSQNTDRHPALRTSTPPRTGPAAMLMPTTPPHTPMARARSFGRGWACVRMAMATGVSMQPPSACAMRKTISQFSEGARLHRAEPAVNSTRPRWRTRRRPTRSAVAPARMSSEASTRV